MSNVYVVRWVASDRNDRDDNAPIAGTSRTADWNATLPMNRAQIPQTATSTLTLYALVPRRVVLLGNGQQNSIDDPTVLSANVK